MWPVLKNCVKAVIGQSKGAEFAAALGCLRPDLVEVTLTNSGFISNPIHTPLKFGNLVFEPVGMDFWDLAGPGFNRETDILKASDFIKET